MRFGTHETEGSDYDRRNSKRWLARATCGIRGPDGAASSVTLRNISEGGFGASCTIGVQDGDRLTFRLGRTGHAPARVIWHRGAMVGCQFLRQVSAAEVALAIATASPVPSQESVAEGL